MVDSRPTLLALVMAITIAACNSPGSTGTTSAPAGPTTSAGDTEEATMELTSSAFGDQGSIPAVYTCDGDNVSPPLTVTGPPPEAVSIALLLEDPDAPGGTFDHWVAYNIEPTTDIPENVGELGTSGTNSFGRLGYGGPCPPSGAHRYVFTVYALDGRLDLPSGSSKAQVLDAMKGHVIAQDTLTGIYQR